MIKEKFRKIAISKARQSICQQKVSAIGFNVKNEIIYKAMNRHRFVRKGGSIHAEMEVMLKTGKNLKTILICRTNNKGDILPIEPCSQCANKAQELGVRIVSVE